MRRPAAGLVEESWARKVVMNQDAEHPIGGTILPFTVVLDNGTIGPAWTLDVALEVAREAEGAGRRAVRITRGAKTILDGEDLRARL
jgi:hypothetical protein